MPNDYVIEITVPPVVQLDMTVDDVITFPGTLSVGPVGPEGPQGPPGISEYYTVGIDFGSLPLDEKKFTINNGAITPTSKVIGGMFYDSTLVNKDADDLGMDPIGVLLVPGSGIITVYAYGIKGLVSGQYAIWYTVG